MKKSGYLLIAIGVLWITAGASTDGVFLSPRNLSLLLRQTSVTGLLAVGMVPVILIRHIDLSIGSQVGLCGVVSALAGFSWGWPAPLAVAAALATGILLGLSMGAATTFLGVPSFVASLGGLLAFRGLILGITGGETIGPLPESLAWLGQGYIQGLPAYALGISFAAGLAWLQGLTSPTPGSWLRRAGPPLALVLPAIFLMNRFQGLPLPVLLLAATAFGLSYLLEATASGRRLFMMGSNPRAAFLAGVAERPHLLGAFALLGGLSGLAGTVLAGRVGSAAPAAGNLLELDAIAAAVIGGASLRGGRGTVGGAVLGAVLMATLDNLLSLLNAESFAQMMVKGGVLVLAVALDGRKT